MRSVKRSPRGLHGRLGYQSPLCRECEDAIKVVSDTSQKKEELVILSPISGKGVASGIDVNDPTVQLNNIIVEVEDGCVEQIKMSDNESAEELAKEVCQKNDLPDQFVSLLVEHIIDRYPERHIDKKKEEVTMNKEKTKETKSTKSQSDTKEMKSVKSHNKSSNSSPKSQSEIEKTKSLKSENETEERKLVKTQSECSNCS